MTSATFMTEFRSSMTFEYKAAIDVLPTDLNSMAPQHTVPTHTLINDRKPSDAIVEIERTSDAQHSPSSSLGTSLTSSPPLPVESTPMNVGLKQEYGDTSMVYPSSDDSVSVANDVSGYNGDQDDMPSPLAQLQCALEKNGMIGKKIDAPVYPGSEGDLLSRDQERSLIPMNCIDDNLCDGELYKCHLCSYTGNSKELFNSHVDTHFDHKCPYCDYTSRTEGRLKRHVKDFHSENPPESWAGSRVLRSDGGSGGELSVDDSVSSSANTKTRTYRCKQCGFVAYKKNDFWEHNKQHIKAEKLLTCPQCAFVTEYKHHLEYHLRNHYGSKPFKCGKCNYSCVNKSMLNSHMKSHSNIYQYRCSNCSYATKYCHSLKLHLRKYDHKPANVLNMDGTPNPYPVIDVYGTRRGPRPKKKRMDVRENRNAPQALPSTQPNMPYNPIAPMITSNLPMLYPPQLFGGYHGNIFIRPQLNGEGYTDFQQQNNAHFRMKLAPQKCMMCEFTTDHPDVFRKHMIMHAAKDNQDIFKLYGITSDSILQIQENQAPANNFIPNNRHSLEHRMIKYEVNDGETKLTERQPDSQPHLNRPAYLEENRKSTPNPVNDEKIVLQENNYQDAQTNGHKYSCKYNVDDQENLNNNRSVIVSHKTMDTPPAGKQETMDWNESTPRNGSNQNTESSPLDLSNAKSSDSRSSPINQRENEEGSSSSSEVAYDNNGSSFVALSPNSQVSPLEQNTSQGQTRSRRKGKAFKLDRYLQVDDQASPLAPEVDFERTVQEQVEKKAVNGLHETPTPKRLSPENVLPSLPLRESNVMPFKSLPQFSTPLSSPPVSTDSRISYRPFQPTNGYRHDRHSFLLNDAGRPTNVQPVHPQNGIPCSSPSDVPKTEEVALTPAESKWEDAFTCSHCDITFRDLVMYTMHMGYHGYSNPYTCNMCGHESKNKVDFFLHIARAAHA